MEIHLGPAQLTYFLLVLSSIAHSAHLHGKPREGYNNFWHDIIAYAFGFLLMLWGGFFK